MIKQTILIFACLFASSFYLKGQTRFGIKAGLNIADESIESTGVVGTSSSTKGSTKLFQAGVLLDIYLSDSWILQPNFSISPKGTKFTSNSGSMAVKIDYFEMPINLIYKPDGIVSFGGGLYWGYALSGTYTNSLKGYQSSSERDILFDKDYKRVDFGINVSIGIEALKGLEVCANYSSGLSNVADDNVVSIKNQTIGLSLIKLFGNKPKNIKH